MRVRALINPELLVWAREDVGLTVEAAAKKIPVKQERLVAWESGELRPTIKQLRKLAQAYKRPLAVFYLPGPPKKFQAMRDFRRLPGEVAGIESPALRLEIRRARFRREIALELYRELGEEPPTFSLSARLDEDPEEVAMRMRELLGISMEEQSSWRDPYVAIQNWRTALENAGVLVFQTLARSYGVDLAEARGFSLTEMPLPTLVINAGDAPRGRVFSMLHELAHIALREGGLCDMRERDLRPPEEQRIEVFCNHIAGSILVPREHLLVAPEVANHGVVSDWADEELGNLSSRFQVSREVILRRLLILNRTTEVVYRQKRVQFQEEYDHFREERRARSSKGGPPPATQAISRMGKLFARLVLQGFYQEKISSSDVSEYLEVKLQHMPKIETAIFGQPVMFRAAT